MSQRCAAGVPDENCRVPVQQQATPCALPVPVRFTHAQDPGTAQQPHVREVVVQTHHAPVPLCEHARRRRECSQCEPETCYAGKYRNRLHKALRNDLAVGTVARSNKSFQTPHGYHAVKSHIFKKMELYNASLRGQPDLPRMTFHTVVLDHIKPVFVCIRDGEARDIINHYTNLQPLFREDNMQKSHRWSVDDEIYWRENILMKPEFLALYVPATQPSVQVCGTLHPARAQDSRDAFT